MQQLKNWVEQIINTLEVHTETKSNEEAKKAVMQAYKSLYIMKDYFEVNNENEARIKDYGDLGFN
jgi:hypothetical protein